MFWTDSLAGSKLRMHRLDNNCRSRADESCNLPWSELSESRALQVAALRLFSLDGFEQGFEVALAEGAAALALDDLVEECGTILDRLGEDLQHVAFVVAVDQHAKLLELVNRFVDLADTLLQAGVVAMRHLQKLDALLLELRDSAQDVVGGQRQVLHTRAAIKIQVLLDLRFPASLGGLVDGELYAPVAIGHHLR